MGSFIHKMGFIVIFEEGARVEYAHVILIFSFYYYNDEGLHTVYIDLGITIPYIYFKILQFYLPNKD